MPITRSREERYRDVLRRRADLALVIFDRECRFVLAEGGAIWRANKNPADYEGRTLEEAMTKEEARALRPHYERILSGEMVQFEWESAGRIYEARGESFEEGGARLGFLLVQDVTDLQQMLRSAHERQVAHAEELSRLASWQRAVLDSANASIISTTTDGTIRGFNKTAERWLGYSADDVIDSLSPAIIHDATEVSARACELTSLLGTAVDPGFEAFVALARRGLVDENEWTYIRKNGARFPVSLSVTGVRDRTGELLGFLGIATDLTEKKEIDERARKTEEALVRSERRFRAASESGFDALVFVRADRSSEGRIVDFHVIEANRRAIALFEKANREELLTLRISDDTLRLIHGLRQLLERVLDSGESIETEIEVWAVAPHASARWFAVQAIPTGDDVVSIALRDVTARRRDEDAIRASLREKELLLKEVHHRVKNNLQVISSLLNMQARRAAPEARVALEESRARVHSIALLHESLYSANDLGRIDFADYLTRLGEHIAETHRRSNVSLNVSCEGLLLPIEIAVPCGLLVNELVTNAFKHAFIGRAAGQVLVSGRRVDRPAGVELVVRDDGKGDDSGHRVHRGLGSTLIDTLARQLRASVVRNTDDGTCVTVRFAAEVDTPR